MVPYLETVMDNKYTLSLEHCEGFGNPVHVPLSAQTVEAAKAQAKAIYDANKRALRTVAVFGPGRYFTCFDGEWSN